MTSTTAGRVDLRLLVGPALLVGGLVLLKVSDVAGSIGPLDRAKFGWSVPIPMLLLAPGAIGVAARRSGAAAARRVAVATGALLAIVVGVAWFVSSTQVGCDPDPSLATRVLASLPIPIVLGVGWSIAGWGSIAVAHRPILAVLIGAGLAIATGIAMLLTWGVLFPGVTCVPRPTG